MSRLYRELYRAEGIVEWLVTHGNRHTIYPPDVNGVCRDPDKCLREALAFYAPLARVMDKARATGVVEVFRAIKVPHLRYVEWSNIGCCWAYVESSAQAIFGPDRRDSNLTVRFYGQVHADDVDWEETLRLHERYGAEDEIRMEAGAVIELYRIDMRQWHREGLSWRADPWVSRPFKRTLRAQVHEHQDEDRWRGKR